MSQLPLSTMLMDVFAGILAILMMVAAGLLAILVVMNASRGETDANSQLMVLAGVFTALGLAFFLLQRWAKRRRN